MLLILLGSGLTASTASAAPGGTFELPTRKYEAPYSFMHGAFDEEEPGVLDLEATEAILDRVPSTTHTATQLASSMLFDETCWEELYGPSAPQVDPKNETGNRAHCFTRADGSELCWNTDEVETYWGEVDAQVEQYSLAETVWSNYPYTNGHIDTRFWTPQADEAFWNCLGPDAENVYGILALPPPTAASCLEDARNQYGDVCRPINAATKDEICRNLEYYQSWCGRIEMQAQDGNANWSCVEVLEDTADALMTDPSLPHESLLIPERLSTPDGDEIHLLDHAFGPRLTVYDLSPMATASVFDTEGTATASAMAGHEAEVAAWDADPSIESCEEYAYDRTYGLAQLDRLAASHRHDPRWIFDYAHQGSPPRSAGPLYEQRDGTPIEMGHASGGGPWSSIDAVYGSEANAADLTGEPRLYRGGPAFRDSEGGLYWIPDWIGPGEAYTFKNVYAYLHALRKGPPTSWNAPPSSSGYNVTHCEAWRTKQRLYYGDEYFDHASMDQRMKSRGFTDDDFAYVQQKQDELWALFLRFVDETDLVVRRTLLQEIDERLLEGELLGCLPASYTNHEPHVDAALTACDWSPRHFAQQSSAELVRVHDAMYQECVDAVGTALAEDGTIDGTALGNTYRAPDGVCDAGISTTSCNNLQQQFANLEAMDPLQDHASLEAFLDARRTYWSAINHAIDQLPPEARNTGTSSSIAKSTNQHFFGAGATGSLTTGLRLADDPSGAGAIAVCAAEPHVESDNATLIRFLGFEKSLLQTYQEVLMHEGLSDYRQQMPDNDNDNDNDNDDDVTDVGEIAQIADIDTGIRSHGHLVYDPDIDAFGGCLGISAHFAASFRAGYALQYGILTVSVTAGAGGGASVDATTCLTRGPSTSTPTTTQACESRRTSLDFQFKPKLNVDATLDAGVGIGIANILSLDVGIGGRLVLLELGLPNSVTLNWDYKPSGPQQNAKPLYWGLVKSEATIDLLSGNLYLFARLTGPFGIVIAEAVWEFFSWRKDKIKRLTLDETIFDGDNFCRNRLDTTPQGQGLEDRILCLCDDGSPEAVALGYGQYCPTEED